MPEPIATWALTEAADGHLERTAIDEGADVPICLHELGIDPHDLAAIGNQIATERGIQSPRDYSRGMLDGFVLGVRAARLAEGIAE